MQASIETVRKQVRSGLSIQKFLREYIRRLLYDRNISGMPDRKYFEQKIIPLLAEIGAKNVLFIGCRAYTSHYPGLFEDQGITLFTCDIDAFSERFGSPGRHRTIDVCELTPDAFPVAFDAIVFSGVIGFGIDTVPQIEKAGVALASLLAPGKILVQGWNTDRSIDALTNPVWQTLFERTRRSSMNQRVSFDGATHVFDILERRAAS